MSQRDIERLRALENRLRDEAGQHEINALEADSVGATEAAVGQEWRSDLKRELADELATLIAELGQEVGAVESFRGSLNSWIMAYPEQCFSEPQPEELFWLRDAKPGLLDRISASMGRHVAKCLIADFDTAFANFTTSPAHTSEARDSERLNWLDRTNGAMRMGWNVRQAPAGNVSIQSVIFLGRDPVGIRDAIDAAMRQEGGGDE